MKLIRYTYTRLFAVLFVVFGVWALFFYFSMIREVMDETDDRLLNNKGLVVHRMLREPSLLETADTITDNYKIRQISEDDWLSHRDSFYDTKIYIAIENEYEPMRVFKSAFQTTDGQFYEIELYLSTIERDNVIESILFYLILLYVLLLTIVLLGMNLVLKRTFKPLYKLLNWLNSITPNQEVPELKNETEIAEFKLLNDAAVDMQRRSRKAYDEQKDFIGNASHELQTPLAIALNKLELLANEGELTEGQMQLLGDTFDTLQRATRLNKSLLLLSRLQNEQMLQTVEVNLTNIFRRVHLDIVEMYADKKLEVEFVEKEAFIVPSDESLAIILVNNLLKNAIIHSPFAGKIRLYSTSNSIELYNDGTEALDNEKIFLRFYHTNKSNDSKSTGLGLTISKEITLLFGLKLEYKFDSQHCFSLKK